MYTIFHCNTDFNGRCFSYIATSLAWEHARDSCLAKGGRLAETGSDETNRKLEDISQGMHGNQRYQTYNKWYID